ncbi:MAG: D-glycero-beta-D-manno-heptose 1-phosphate adenylyltransferase [Saprospiraceae bacterium]
MKNTFQDIQDKIQDWKTAKETVDKWQMNNQKIVFTNGCFDILHYGHLHYLAEAADLGTKLIIGLNSKASVSRLKGEHRPINDDLTRQFMLASLGFVALVVEFEDDTPFELISLLQPDILVKGGDYQPHEIVGADVVLAKGGEVLSLPFVEGYSTTDIEAKIKGQ